MSVQKEEMLRQFCDVTGAEEDRSKFFLESSNWQLDVALSSFYENGGNLEESPTNDSPASVQQPMSDSDMDSPPVSPAQPQKKVVKTNPQFATIDSLHQESSSDEEEESRTWLNRVEIVQEFFCYPPTCSKKLTSSESEMEADIRLAREEIDKLKAEINRLEKENLELREEIEGLRTLNRESGQAFYAGGSERSGQQIIGPGKARNDIVSEMFKSVRERGATVFDEEPTTTARTRHGVFSGVGYRLGQTADDHEQVTPGNTQTQNQPRQVRLRLYREGFTVDNGPLRHYTDPPENVEFLSSIRRGEIPRELAGRGEVRLSLEDRRLDECPPQSSKTAAFTGKGHMLGSPTPVTVGVSAPVAVTGNDREANLRAAQEALKLDDGPVTTVQFRLADGSRLAGRFNHSHTVGDLVEFVARAEPTVPAARFALLTSFPCAELADPAVTLAQANLLNSTLLQRLK